MRRKTRFRDEYGNLREWAFVAGMVGTILLLIPVTFLAVSVLSSTACDNRWPDFTHRYELLGGCLVEYEGTWYPAGVVRSVIK